MNNHQDFLKEETETRNQPLVGLLREVYHPGQQDMRSLARMRARLFHGTNQISTQHPFSGQHSQQHPSAQQQFERIDPMSSSRYPQNPPGQTQNVPWYPQSSPNDQQGPSGPSQNWQGPQSSPGYPQVSQHMSGYAQGPSWSPQNTLRPPRRPPGSQRLQRGLTVLAAVLVLALLAGSFLLALNYIHGQQVAVKPTPGITPTMTVSPVATSPTATATAVPLPHTPTQVQDVHMLNSTTGWITCADGSVLRTTDGGLNWKDVTPQALLAIKQKYTFAQGLFPSASTAWIVVEVMLNTTSTNNLQSVIFHSSDGGQSWQKGALSSSEPYGKAGSKYALASISAEEVWVLDMGGTISDRDPTPISLYHTSNGGQTWAQTNVPPVQIFNHLLELSFANQQTGIITGLATTNENEVYLTQDGGATWKSILIPSPNAQWRLTTLFSPQFVTPDDGFFTASYITVATEGATGVSSGQGFSVFSTHDGGQTWNSSPITNIGMVGSVTKITFLDTQQGYAQGNTGQVGQPTLWITSDGGQQWSLAQQGLPNQVQSTHMSELNFISLSTGWVLRSDQPGEQSSPIGLYTTTNSGQTWNRVPALFPSFITPPPAS